jgi:hypothetical protein
MLLKKFLLITLLILGFSTLAPRLFGQINNGDFGKVKKDSLIDAARETDSLKSQKDMIDILYSIIGHKRQPVKDTSKINRKKIFYSVLPGVGFALQTAIGAITSANVSFYTANEADENLSSITLVPSYAFSGQFLVSLVSNVWTKGNKYNWLGDYRFYRYPTTTYGLGGKTTTANADVINYSYFSIHQVMARQIMPDFLLGIGYDLDYHWSITEKGRTDKQESDFQKYGFRRRSTSSGISLNVIYDTRRNLNNPVSGYYMNLALRPSLKFLGSDANWQSMQLDVRKYIKFPANSNNVLAFWSFDWLVLNGKAPYLDLPAIGWDSYLNTGRGYAQDRFKGTKLLFLESEYRFGISRNGLLGGVVFTNAETLTEWPSGRFNGINPAIGTGLRIKINKGSGTNFCVDYAVGLHGSNGFFFNLGEVF